MSDGFAAERDILQRLAGKWVVAAMAAAAELGVADVLAEAPRDVASLAGVLGCEAAGLERLLRVLSGEGLLSRDLEGRFHLTAAGEPLREGRLRDLVRFAGTPFSWQPWAALPSALAGGASAFERTHGQALFEYLDGHEDDARLYHAAVDAFTRTEARALAAAHDFTDVQRVVDVGGGMGTLLVELACQFPHLTGVLFDRPSVIEAARVALRERAKGARIELCAGDFLEDAFPRADVFVVKHVLHNWDDARAISLLARCAGALEPGGRVLIVEGILLPGDVRDATRLLDLEMLVLCGAGRERSKPEFRALLRQAGLGLQHTCDLAGTTRLLVCAPR